jgi:hypothetical protein
MIWTPRVAVQGAGVLISTIGFLCLPLGFGGNPKRDTSLFSNFADLGLFFQFALILIPAGVVVALLSFLLPRDD